MSNNITLISDLSTTKIKSITKTKSITTDNDRDSLSELVVDLLNPLRTRINGLELFYEQFGQEECNEIVNRLSMMYQFSGTKILEKYIYEICTNCKISPVLKITAAKSLCAFDTNKKIGFKALNIVCQDMENVATPCKIDAVCLLMVHKSYKIQSKELFCKIINNQDLECDYRYKTILSLENKDIKNKSYF